MEWFLFLLITILTMTILTRLVSMIKKRKQSYELSGEFIFLKTEVQMSQMYKKELSDDAGRFKDESSIVIPFPRSNIQ